MTRCTCCDANLEDIETTAKIVREDGSFEYPDMCRTCLKELPSTTKVVFRNDLLAPEKDTSPEPDDDPDYDPFKFLNDGDYEV